MAELAFHKAIVSVWSFIGLVNKYVDATAPWTLAKEPEHAARLDQVLYNMVESLRCVGLLVFPFLPNTGTEIWKRLGLEQPAEEGRLTQLKEWGGLAGGLQTERGQSLFPRIELT